MIIEDNFFPDPKQVPSKATVGDICDQFAEAGLACRTERHQNEVWVIFDGRKSNLVFTVNPSGNPLTATMPNATDYDADFASAIFQVFESIGWTYAPV